MEYRSDVQSLGRGLRILEIVSERPGSSTSEISLACELPRTTTHRLLVTLAQNGFVRRDEWTQKYLPTSRVLRLVGAFDANAQVTEKAKSILDELGTEFDWPLHFAVRENFVMRIRASTDRTNPLAVHKVRPGSSIPILQCAAGLACLAGQPATERERIVAATVSLRGEVPWTRPELERTLAEVEQRGYALFRRPQRFSPMIGLSVPVRIDGRIDTALSVRFPERAVPISRACERFLPHLIEAAARLGDANG